MINTILIYTSLFAVSAIEEFFAAVEMAWIERVRVTKLQSNLSLLHACSM